MARWLKRIGILAAALVALEVVAWVGIALLGPDAVTVMLDFYDPRQEAAAVTTARKKDGSVQKCTTYGGELYCISDAPETGPLSAPATQAPSHNGRRCTEYNGDTFCIEENI
jgi:hypothetical protein